MGVGVGTALVVSSLLSAGATAGNAIYQKREADKERKRAENQAARTEASHARARETCGSSTARN